MIYEDFFGARLAALREEKRVSGREMSLAIGLSANYINKIENKKAYPSMEAFFYICEYLGVTPQEFFDTGNKNPAFLKEVIGDLKKLDARELDSVSGIIKVMIGKK